jgi:ribosomal protein S18 acetylase RimI-like enzyme
MTQEEKAKAYDEALKQAKFYHGNCPSEPERKKLEKMFPALRESKDERMRKSLIKFLTEIKEISESGRTTWAVREDDAEMCKSFLAYLEKQRDASKAIEAVDRIDKYIDENVANAHDMKDSNPDKKYYRGWDDALGKMSGILQDVYSGKKQKEQEPAGATINGEPIPTENQSVDIPLAEWSEDYNEDKLQTRFAFYTYKDEPSVLYLSNVFVEKACRTPGYGTRILKAAEKVAEVVGATTIRLKVKQESLANAWYRKNGYSFMTLEDGYNWLEKNIECMKPNKQELSEEDERMQKEVEKMIVLFT